MNETIIRFFVEHNTQIIVVSVFFATSALSFLFGLYWRENKGDKHARKKK